ncbi:hypothetical protein MFORT_22895 [Mycolicibacterium fortuitum subsp. fortuitum DSM 46621 = ATCC 6841 = JCM 6387]|uniref:Uncharacterized protein n=1 Tax=Mycolicibacterium fortuitum subsp. fortuitum DSM 46621 = ATCC 6841 = JCM 6387 TaxID=1214102 RepID=K0UQA5_MYCFO|nr:hypothetical protein G155_25835 [Mycobacterium sp. VKM Ac-1817D]EJZ09322.1 hypothetical protein MFORT_22895 [Mycolicibacterium fortuitum subsp. fortuitum DSM 46621 = ATCC 6841 = JCM 6387]
MDPSDDLVLPELQLAGADPHDRPTAGRQELQPDDVVRPPHVDPSAYPAQLIGDRDLSDGPGESAAHDDLPHRYWTWGVHRRFPRAPRLRRRLGGGEGGGEA